MQPPRHGSHGVNKEASAAVGSCKPFFSYGRIAPEAGKTAVARAAVHAVDSMALNGRGRDMRKKINAEWLKRLMEAKNEVTKPAQEVAAQLYESLVNLPELRLSDGTIGKVEVYYAPEADEEGCVHCGIDVRLSNGNLLEFTLKNTGWEKSFAHEIPPRRTSDRQV
jgi:hypothetical protein